MENQPLHQRKVVVTLEDGLHMRPMSQIAHATGGFDGEVTIRRAGGPAVNAKSIFDLLTLRAENGMELVLAARGEGAAELLDRLVAMFDSNFEWDSSDSSEDEFAEEEEPPSASEMLGPCPQTAEPE